MMTRIMSDVTSHALWDIKREALVPISIDLDVDGVRVIDAFMWDLHQSQLSPEQFSRRMSEELGLPRSFIQPLEQSISRQLLEYRYRLPVLATEGTIAAAEENMCYLDIDIRFRSVVYRDRLQWDINCLHNSPERFARCTVADLGLPQDMEAVIAITIHQQVCKRRLMAPMSSTAEKDLPPTAGLGPRLSSVQPVDQYEFNARDWSDNRPTSNNQNEAFSQRRDGRP